MKVLLFLLFPVFTISCKKISEQEYIYIETRLSGFSQHAFIDTFYESDDRKAFIRSFDTYMKNTAISNKISQAAQELKDHPKNFNLMKNGIDIGLVKYPEKTNDIDSIMKIYFPQQK